MRLLGPSFEGAIVPVDPPPVDRAIMDAQLFLVDTMVPVEPPLFHDEMVAADEFTKSGERGIKAYIEQNPVYENLGGSVYRCKAK